LATFLNSFNPVTGSWYSFHEIGYI
jgi:hypothetical protein